MAKAKTQKQPKAKAAPVSTLANAKIGADGKVKLSAAKRKKLAKMKKKALQMSYCWYCEREFEDDKVLLAHQKAKHFKCSHCPRRLNTAGGLAVHMDQVHKLGTDKIENAIPGRESFDVEIYGMEGIPAADLREWRKRKEIEAGINVSKIQSLRPKIDKGVISQSDLKRQLKAHKELQEGTIAPSQAANIFAGGAVPQPFPAFSAPQMPQSQPPMMMQPPPMMMGMPQPPPGMAFPPMPPASSQPM